MASAPSLSLTCPKCGGAFVAPMPPTEVTSWVSCPHCATALPVVAPREPPPLFSWEVYPHLYPRLPPPTSPVRRVPVVGLIALLLLTSLLAGLAGLFAYGGTVALTPSSYSVAGVVQLNGGGPLPNAVVILMGENGFNALTMTPADGSFAFTSVPAGGMTLNVTTPTYGFLRFEFFLTPLYQSPAGDPQRIVVSFSPDPASGNVTFVRTPFADLETFVTSLFSGTVVLGVGAIVAAVGALAIRRQRSPTIPLAGGAAGIAAPAAVASLGLTPVFVSVAIVGAATIALGALVVVLYAMWMARVGRAPEVGGPS